MKSNFQKEMEVEIGHADSQERELTGAEGGETGASLRQLVSVVARIGIMIEERMYAVCEAIEGQK